MKSTISRCECCGSTKATIERRLNEALLLILGELCELYLKERKEIKYDRPFNAVKQKFNRTPSDYAVLQDFRLTVKRGDPGHWIPTKEAYYFLVNKVQIPRYFTETIESKVFSEEMIYASDIIKEKIIFSWSPVTSLVSKAKPVFQFDHNGQLVKEFPSIVEACRELSLHGGAILNSIEKGYRSGGFHWSNTRDKVKIRSSTKIRSPKITDESDPFDPNAFVQKAKSVLNRSNLQDRIRTYKIRSKSGLYLNVHFDATFYWEKMDRGLSPLGMHLYGDEVKGFGTISWGINIEKDGRMSGGHAGEILDLNGINSLMEEWILNGNFWHQ